MRIWKACLASEGDVMKIGTERFARTLMPYQWLPENHFSRVAWIKGHSFDPIPWILAQKLGTIFTWILFASGVLLLVVTRTLEHPKRLLLGAGLLVAALVFNIVWTRVTKKAKMFQTQWAAAASALGVKVYNINSFSRGGLLFAAEKVLSDYASHIHKHSEDIATNVGMKALLFDTAMLNIQQEGFDNAYAVFYELGWVNESVKARVMERSRKTRIRETVSSLL